MFAAGGAAAAVAGAGMTPLCISMSRSVIGIDEVVGKSNGTGSPSS